MAADILAEITGMLVEIVGDEHLLADEVTMKTTFNEDLALESIEFVALAELLHHRYGAEVDLMGFLSEKDMDGILAMSVGELVTHIGRITHASLAHASHASPAHASPAHASLAHASLAHAPLARASAGSAAAPGSDG